MSDARDGGSAFPLDVAWVINPGKRGLIPASAAKGMSLRDYFAAKALGGALCDGYWPTQPDSLDAISRECYAIADAMLAARGGTK